MALSINEMSVERSRSLVKATETKSGSGKGGRMNDTMKPTKKQAKQKSGKH